MILSPYIFCYNIRFSCSNSFICNLPDLCKSRISPKQTVLLYRLNIQKTIILKDKSETLGKFRNIHNPMKLSIYQGNSVTLAPLKINSTLMLKTEVVCNLIFICFMHIFVHFSVIT